MDFISNLILILILYLKDKAVRDQGAPGDTSVTKNGYYHEYRMPQ